MRQLVLVADDDPYVRDLLVDALFEEGYRVHAADGAVATLAYVAIEVPDLVVADVHPAEMTGDELVRRLRRRRLAVPVVLIGAEPHAADRPGVRFVRRPFSVGDVVAAVLRSLPPPPATQPGEKPASDAGGRP